MTPFFYCIFLMFISWMLIMPSFKKSLIVEQFQGICQHCGVKTNTVTPYFYYVFNISLSCNINIPSFIGNLWWVLLLGNHLKQRKQHAFWWTPEFVSVELFTGKKCSKTSKGFVFLKLTAKPKFLESLKRSWKKSWKVMEFEELKRVRTL